jgi:hypothetical protein
VDLCDVGGGLAKGHYRRGGEYVDAILMALRLPD